MQAGLAASDASNEEAEPEPSLDVSVLGLAAAGSPLFSPNDPSDTILSRSNILEVPMKTTISLL